MAARGFSQVRVVGCECNRATLDTIRAAGFELETLERTTLHTAPRFVRPLIAGVATA